MDRKILFLKRSLMAESTFGILLAVFMVFLTVSLTMDNPDSTVSNMLLAAVFVFCGITIPLVILPIMAIRELNDYPVHKNLLMNYVNSGIAVGFVFFPLAIWQLYTLVKLKSLHPDATKK